MHFVCCVLQLLVKAAACDVFGITADKIHTGVDGCSAPAFAMPLHNAALGFARLCLCRPGADGPADTFASPGRAAAIARVIAAVTSYPLMVRVCGCVGVGVGVCVCVGVWVCVCVWARVCAWECGCVLVLSCVCCVSYVQSAFPCACGCHAVLLVF